MKLNKTIALVAAVLLTTIALLGCGASKPVLAATVGDQEVTVQQLTINYKNSLNYASAYGYDTSTDEGIASFRDYLLDNLISSAMKIYQAEQAEITSHMRSLLKSFQEYAHQLALSAQLTLHSAAGLSSSMVNQSRRQSISRIFFQERNSEHLV